MVERLAENRLEAIKDGRSIRSIIDSANDGVSMEIIKGKIDEEIQAAKEAGLNFNMICHMWLFDVGVQNDDTSSFTGLTVPKFLNRCLGLRLNKQKLMTQYFLKHLESEIYAAKSAGEEQLLGCIVDSVCICMPSLLTLLYSHQGPTILVLPNSMETKWSLLTSRGPSASEDLQRRTSASTSTKWPLTRASHLRLRWNCTTRLRKTRLLSL